MRANEEHLIKAVKDSVLYSTEIIGKYFISLRSSCALPGELDPFSYCKGRISIVSRKRFLILRRDVNGYQEGTFVDPDNLKEVGKIVRIHITSLMPD